MDMDQSQLTDKSGFEVFMIETFEDQSSKKYTVQAFLINALIILSIGAIIYESFLENKIETTQAAAEQAYRTMIRSNPEMEITIQGSLYEEEKYWKLYEELRELRLTSRPDYL